MQNGTQSGIPAFIAEQTSSRIGRLKAELARAAAQPHEAEALHDVRVASRRLLACLRLFRDHYADGWRPKLRRQVRKVMKRCGAVRNCDVTLQLLDTVGVPDPRLRKTIREERGRLAQKLARKLAKAARKSQHWPVATIPASANGESASALAHRVLPALGREWLAAGDAAKDTTPAELHSFRIASKRFRYTLELFETVYGSRTRALVNELKQVQDQLGDINDCETAAELAAGHTRALARLRQEQQRRTRAFLAAWQRARRRRQQKVDRLDSRAAARRSPKPAGSAARPRPAGSKYV